MRRYALRDDQWDRIKDFCLVAKAMLEALRRLYIALPDILSPEESVEVGYFGIGLKSGRKHTDKLAPLHVASQGLPLRSIVAAQTVIGKWGANVAFGST